MKKNLLLPVLLFFIASKLFALNYYWVGGSGNWSDYAHHWATSSGGNTFHNQVPQSTDNVFFDAASFTTSRQIVTVDQTVVHCADMSWTGVTYNPAFEGSTELQIYGSFTLSAGMLFNFNGNVSFEATSTGKTITTAGVPVNTSIFFNGIGGEWTLQDVLTCQYYIYLDNGSLNTNNQTVTAYGFTSYNSTTRSLTLGSSVINLLYSGTAWDINPTGMTMSAAASTINFNATSGGMTEFAGGGFNYGNIFFNGTNIYGRINSPNSVINDVNFLSDGDIVSNTTFNNVTFNGNGAIYGGCIFNTLTFMKQGAISGSNTFNTLILSPGYTYILEADQTQTINNTFDVNGNCGALISILKSSAIGSQAYISKSSGAVTVSYVTLKDINATGGATFIANNAIDLGNNNGWTINSLPSQNLYWVGNGGNWDDGSHWSLTSGGSPSGCSPTPMDNVFFDSNSFSTSGQTVTVNIPTAYCNNMTWTGVSYSPVFEGSTELKIYGSLALAAGMTFNYSGIMSFDATTTGKTITTAGVPINTSINFNGIGGGWTLQDALTCQYYIYLDNGSLNTNNQTVTAYGFISYNSTTRSLALGSSVINLLYSGTAWDINPTGMTMSAAASTINFNATSGGMTEFAGGGFNYNNIFFNNIYGRINSPNSVINDVNFSSDGDIVSNTTFNNVTFNGNGAIYSGCIFNTLTFMKQGTISGSNTFNTLILSPGYTYILEANQTQTINNIFDVNGNCGALISILKSSAIGSQAYISKSSGAVTVSYVTLKDINATGGATFIANNAIDLGNNNGWTINSLPSQNLYWVGNGGNWDDGNHWALTSGGSSSGCSPTPMDNVFFDSNSFSTSGQTVTVNIPTAYCNNMTWTGVSYSPVFEGSTELKIYGSLTLAAGMAFNYSGIMSFEATTTGKTITTAGVPINTSINFNGIGGEWTLQDALTCQYYIYLDNGSLNTNNQTVTAYGFTSYNSTTRSLTLGSSVINLLYSGTVWDVNPTGMTMSAAASTINFNATSGGITEFAGGGFNYGNIFFNGTNIYGRINSPNSVINDVNFLSDGDIVSNCIFNNVVFSESGTIYTGGSTFNNLTFTKQGDIWGSSTFNNLTFSPGYTYTLEAVKTQTVTNLCATGTGALPIRIQSSNVGTQTTISKATGTMCWDYVRISDLNATGGATFDAGLAPAHSEDLGNNTGFVFAGSCTPVSCTPCNPPLVTTQPANSAVCVGSNSAFTVGATGTGLVYQWQVNTGSGFTNLSDVAPYSGSTSNTLQLTAATIGLNGYQYRCIVSGTCSPVATSNSAALTVNPATVVTVNAATICAGQTATLTASGATTYSWNTGATTNSVTVNPITTTSYTVTGTTNGCSATAVTTVIVNPLPTVNVNSATILSGQNATLTATGASAYSWSTGETTSVITVSPAATTSYTVTGTSNGCSDSAIATITVTTQSATYYRSRQTGNWSSASTWQVSTNNSTWSNATQAPNYTNVSTITIQSGHTVTINTAVTVDELVINGTLVYPNNAGVLLTINNGTGADLTINGTFRDERTTAIIWNTNATWSMGTTGTLIRSSNTSASNWNTRYEGGINNIPPTANWIIRKTGANNPPLNATAGMYYPNLIIENNTAGTWVTAVASSITGAAAAPIIKGDLNIGGNGTGNVSFLNSNTNTSPVFVGGSLTVKTASTLRNQGTGFEVQGNLVLNGTVNYGNSNAAFVLSGSANQSISGTGTLPFRNLQLNKTTLTAAITLLNPATISGTAIFTNGYLNTTATNVLTFTNGSVVTGANTNSFVNGPVRKTGNSAFVFPTGKNGNYQPVAISAPTSAAATYVAEYFHQDAALGTNKDATIDSVSNCEYWTLNNSGTAFPVRVTVGWNTQSCYVATIADAMLLTYWNGTMWTNLGNNYSSIGKVTSLSTINSYGIFTLAQQATACNAACAPQAISQACDLVCNGKFEYYTTLPAGVGTPSYDPISGICKWQRGSGGTSDYFHQNATNPMVQVPGNSTGTQSSYGGGNGYAGLFAWVSNWTHGTSSGNNYHEYITQELISPLQPGHTYRATMWVSLSEKSSAATANLGMYFSTTSTYYNAYQGYGIISVIPQVVSTPGTYITDQTHWVKITGLITPSVPMQWLTIGSFSNTIQYISTPTSETGYGAYYYIDEVSVIEEDPDFTVSPPTSICSGQTATLTASGAVSYEWLPGGQTTASITVSPTTTTTYTVIGTDVNGCKRTLNTTIVVYPTPIVTIAPQAICPGETAQLYAHNYPWQPNTFTWNPGNLPNLSHVSPVTTTTYTVTDSYGCTNIGTITVKPLPNVTVSPTFATICAGSSVSLTASGATYYNWAPGNSGLNSYIIANPIASPTVSTTYTVTGISSVTNCRNTATTAITVRQPPILNQMNNITVYGCNVYVPATIFTSTPSTGVTYQWTNSNPAIGVPVNGTGNLPGFTAVNTTSSIITATITVTASANVNGCVSPPRTFTISILPCCIPSNGISIVNGNVSTLSTASGVPITGNSLILTNQDFSINGNFIVNQNLVLRGCTVTLGAMAKITVNPGYTLTITNNGRNDKSHLYACSDMWDGIYLPQANSTLVINNGSTIEDAINAVVSDNRGKFTISSTTDYGNVIFNKNYKSIVVRNASSGNHPGTVSSTTIQCNDGVPGGNPTNTNNKLHYPYTTVRSATGIDISNTYGITIGNPANIDFKNTFTNLDNGIIAYNASVAVYNNTFLGITYMGNATGECFKGVAICASASNGNRTLTVGSSNTNTTYRNYFQNCYRGIGITGYTNANIRNNTFMGITNTAIRAAKVYNGRTITASTNTISYAGIGIDCYDNKGTTVNIGSNTIDGGIWYAYAQGIRAGEISNAISNPATTYTITGNTISNVQYGINASGLRTGNISTNTISNIKTISPSTPSYGIYLANSTNCRVQSNVANGPNSSDYWVCGIRIETSTSNRITCNEVNNIGDGLFFSGVQSPNTVIAKNLMNNNSRALVLNYAVVGQQGGLFNPTDNRWTNISSNQYHTFSYYSTGSNSPFYVRNAYGVYRPVNYQAFSNTGQSGVIPLNPTLGSNSIQCPAVSGGGSGIQQQILTTSALQIAEDSITPVVYQASTRSMLRQSLYSYLQTDNSLTYSYPQIAQFRNYHDQHTIGKMDRAEQVINNTQNQTPALLQWAKLLNNSATLTSLADTNSQWMNNLLIDNALAGGVDFTNAELTDLRALAVKCPYQDGRAVLQARTILSQYDTTLYMNDCEIVLPPAEDRSMTIAEIEEISNSINNIFRLYPNPNDGTMNFVYSIEPTSKGELFIYDISGRLISNYQLQANDNLLLINETQLSEGIYFYKVIIDGLLKATDRIVIIR